MSVRNKMRMGQDKSGFVCTIGNQQHHMHMLLCEKSNHAWHFILTGISYRFQTKLLQGARRGHWLKPKCLGRSQKIGHKRWKLGFSTQQSTSSETQFRSTLCWQCQIKCLLHYLLSLQFEWCGSHKLRACCNCFSPFSQDLFCLGIIAFYQNNWTGLVASLCLIINSKKERTSVRGIEPCDTDCRYSQRWWDSRNTSCVCEE